MKSFMIVLFLVALGGCSTVAGVGQDVKDAAEYTKEKISKTL